MSPDGVSSTRSNSDGNAPHSDTQRRHPAQMSNTRVISASMAAWS